MLTIQYSLKIIPKTDLDFRILTQIQINGKSKFGNVYAKMLH